VSESPQGVRRPVVLDVASKRKRRSRKMWSRWRAFALLTLTVSLGVAWATADARTRPLLQNTLVYAGGSTLLALPVGLALALLIHRTDLPGRRLLLAVIATMLFVPPYLQLAGWEAGLGLQGWLCRWLFPGQPFAVLSGWRGAIWVQTLVNLPWIVLILSAALVRMPRELEEQASLYGSPGRVLQGITLPLLRPALIASGLAVFVIAANDITITDVYQIRTFAEEIYTGFALGDTLRDVPLRTLPGMLLLGGLALAGLVACAQISRTLPIDRHGDCWRVPTGRYAVPIWLALAALLALLVAVPLASLIYQAGLQVRLQGSQRVREWSLVKVGRIMASTPARFGHEFAWTFLLAQLTSISVLLGAIVLSWLGRTSRVIWAMGWGLGLLGLVVPGPLLALLLGRMLNQPSWPWMIYLYDRTLLLPWMTLGVRLFPFAYLVTDLLMHRMPQRPLDLARLAGARRGQWLSLVIWPQLGPVLGWLWLVLIALTVADLSATILAVPPGVTTLAIRIFNLVHYGVADQLAGLCLGVVLLYGGLAALVVAFWPAHPSTRKV
jgi:iron(III) transport system permease protein